MVYGRIELAEENEKMRRTLILIKENLKFLLDDLKNANIYYSQIISVIQNLLEIYLEEY